MEKYDAAIVGGGPAGSTAALYLNRQGFNVCLIEKKTYPRETLCGEFLSKEVIDSLINLNLFEGFLKLAPNPIIGFKFYSDGVAPIQTELKFTAYGIKRGTFDNYLLDAVKNAGITVFQPMEVKEIIYDKELIILKVDDGKSSQKICCGKVIVAYGKQNILDKKLNRDFASAKSFLNGVKFHIDKSLFTVLEKNTIQMFVSKGIYCGVNYVGDNKVTVCFLENRRKIQNNPRDQIKFLIGANKNFARLFTKEIINVINDLPLYGTGNIYFGKRNLIKDGIYFIGDSSAVIAPFAGDGIGMAMQNARLISEVFAKQRSDRLDDIQLELLYTHEWKKLFKRRLFIAKSIQNIILNNILRGISYKIIQTFPGFLNFIIRVTRG
jgi:menaquinone-9 beta-reductase